MEKFKTLLDVIVLQNTVGAYLWAMITLLGLIFVFILLKKLLVSQLGKIAAKTANDFDDFFVSLISQIGLPVFIAIAFYLASLPLTLPGTARNLVRYALIIVLTIRSILLLQEVVRYGIVKIYAHRMRPEDSATKAMISSTTGVLRWVLWSLGLIFILDNLGVDISALVAGIGIGGVAVALAAQAILGDAFSALSIFLDRPFEIGDFIIIDDHLGTVEHIGIKTTRIRSLSGEQLIFSNSDLTKSRIKNYKRMDSRRVLFKIGVVYQTSLENVKKIPELVKAIFGKMEGVKLDRVHFQSFGDFSLNYEIVYYVLSADYNIYMDKQQEINFALMESFQKEGIAFAYPTQTLYLQKEGL
jgi:small-conductance mechanosensitive channel